MARTAFCQPSSYPGLGQFRAAWSRHPEQRPRPPLPQRLPIEERASNESSLLKQKQTDRACRSSANRQPTSRFRKSNLKPDSLAVSRWGAGQGRFGHTLSAVFVASMQRGGASEQSWLNLNLRIHLPNGNASAFAKRSPIEQSTNGMSSRGK
jgi:hypothetical protein